MARYPTSRSSTAVALAVLAGLGANAELKSSIVYPESTFFSTSYMPYYSTLNIPASNGDLWPMTWADDDAIYAANGDGNGFSTNPKDFRDAVVNKIMGTPESGISGQRLRGGDELGPIWADDTQYNRKPTGIVAVDGDGDGKDELYLVIQALKYGEGAFNDVPAASILKSTDYGDTWTATDEPMFSDYVFTTVWFLDYGKSNQRASVLGDDGAKYVYAYGLDNNWRDSVPNTVPDPQDLWLARAPVSSIQDITTWEWFSGSADKPAWSDDIANRKSVLHDERRDYPGADPEAPIPEPADGFSVLSQGSVVYNAPLKRYIYSSWTDYTFDLYEAPQPWGPWTLFDQKDFGVTPWYGLSAPDPKNGGYATVIPSKWISEDGLKMWMNANFFVGNGTEDVNYCVSLREVTVTNYSESEASNEPSDDNLASPESEAGKGATPICKGAHHGNLEFINDGKDASEDSWDGSIKEADRWGYIWPQKLNMNHVTYTSGDSFSDGGWFIGNLTVQVRQDFEWKDVSGLKISPEYPYDNTAVPKKTFEFTFDDVAGDGVQIIGAPGGTFTFTSISELEVSYQKS